MNKVLLIAAVMFLSAPSFADKQGGKGHGTIIVGAGAEGNARAISGSVPVIGTDMTWDECIERGGSVGVIGGRTVCLGVVIRSVDDIYVTD